MRVLAICAVCFLFAAGSVFSAGVDLTGIGARAQALGSYRGVSDDWSGMFWNPAGIVFSDGFSAGFSLEFITPIVSYTAKPLNSQFVGGTSNQEIENERKTFPAPSGGLIYSNGKYAFGLGVWAPFGLGGEWDLLSTSGYNKEYPRNDFEDNLQVIDIHPTFAIKLSENFSVGAGVSLIMADIMIRKPNFTPNPYVFNPMLAQVAGALTATSAAMGAPSPVAPPFTHLLTESTLDGSGTGFGANLGLMFKPTPTLSIGASVQYYQTIGLEGTVDAVTYFANHPVANGVVNSDQVKPQFDAMLAGGMITPDEYAVLVGFYSGATPPRDLGLKVKADMPLPIKAGIGVAYSGISNLLITADAAMTQWSSWDVIKIKKANGNEFSELVENWENSIRLGLGLEYNLTNIILRGGFYTENQAVVEETMTPSIPDVGRRSVFLAGVEVPVGPLRLHASYERMNISDMDVTEWVPTADGTGYDNMAGLYSMYANLFMFGVDYAF